MPEIIGQFGNQTIPAGNSAQVVLSPITGVHPGDPMLVATGAGGTVGELPIAARSVNPGEIIVTIWNVSGIGQVISSPLVFKVVLL